MTDWKDYIHSDPNILGGKPVVKGTRLGVTFIASLMKCEWTLAQILDAYPELVPEQVDAVRAYYLQHTGEVDAEIAQQAAENEAAYQAWLQDPNGGQSPRIQRLRHLLRATQERSD